MDSSTVSRSVCRPFNLDKVRGSDPAHLHLGAGVNYLDNGLDAAGTIRVARDLLDRFFRDADGQTNKQLDVYYTLEDLRLGRESAQPALGFLISRGLINFFGPDVAFLTDRGIQVAVSEVDLGSLPQDSLRDTADQPSPHASGRPQQPLPPSARPERATLTHIDLDGQEFTIELGWTCTIGRAEGNTIRIGDKRASKQHAEIRYETGQYVLLDLSSANGTLVNGHYALEPTPLKHDDEIVIGRTMLLYAAPEPLPPPRASANDHYVGTHDEPSASGYRVVQGTPDYGPTERPATADMPQPLPEEAYMPDPAGSPPQDLFEAGGSDDLFGPPPQERASSQADSALFGDGQDLFGSPPSGPTPAANSDLFGPPEPDGDPFGGPPPAPPHMADISSLAELGLNSTPFDGDRVGGAPGAVTSLADGLQASLQEPLEELEPFESLDGADENDEWNAAPTQAGAPPLLENQPVVQTAEMADAGADGATMAQPRTDDMATIMVSREDLFGSEGPHQEAEPPRWGEAEDVHPAFSADAGRSDPRPSVADGGLDGVRAAAEVLPEAKVEFASWIPPKAPASTQGPSETLGDKALSFLVTLQVLRQRLEVVDVPEKGALLEAVEVLSQHPYVRVVLESLDN